MSRITLVAVTLLAACTTAPTVKRSLAAEHASAAAKDRVQRLIKARPAPKVAVSRSGVDKR